MDGRFANQLFQYSFAHCYAEKFGMRLQTPEWIGRDMFGLRDERIQGGMPAMRVENDRIATLLSADAPAITNCHLLGYFNHHSKPYAPFRENIRGLFAPVGPFREAALRLERWMDSLGGPIVALHLRRGDFGYGQFWVAPDEWYLDWLDGIWANLPGARLYIASDSPSAREAFARYNPVSQPDSGVDLGAFNFFIDFLALANANVLGISNSTFSFFAGMLNSRAKMFMRPDPKVGAMRPFDPWDAPVLLQK
jgi:hypothetical protein